MTITPRKRVSRAEAHERTFDMTVRVLSGRLSEKKTIMTFRIVLSLAYVFFTLDSYPADIYKCVTRDGKISYSDSPCPDAKRIQPGEPPKLNLDRLSARQADLALDCIEAVDNVVNRVPRKLLLELTESAKTGLIKEFARFCPALGFQSPLGESTKEERGQACITVLRCFRRASESVLELRERFSSRATRWLMVEGAREK